MKAPHISEIHPQIPRAGELHNSTFVSLGYMGLSLHSHDDVENQLAKHFILLPTR